MKRYRVLSRRNILILGGIIVALVLVISFAPW